MERELDNIKQNLYNSTLRRKWDKVIEIYKDHPEMHDAKITKAEDTALHVAVVHGAEDIVVKLIDEVEKTGHGANTLSAKNKRGDTTLHCAASRGSKAICERIIDVAQFLVNHCNNQKETPLFLAALFGHKETFLFLHFISNMNPDSTATLWRREGGDTILHCTLQREYFDLSFEIIRLHKEQHIATSVNERGITPLHVLASKPTAFESGTHLRWWTKILYYCTIVEPLQFDPDTIVEPLQFDAPPNESQAIDIDTTKNNESKSQIDENMLPHNYRTCLQFFNFLWNVVLSVMKRGARSETGNSANSQNTYFPLNYVTLFEFLKCSYIYVFGLAGLGLLETKNIKERHVWCSQIMDELIEQHSEYEYFVDGTIPSLDDERRRIFLVKNNDNENKEQNQQGMTSKKNDQQKEMKNSITEMVAAIKNALTPKKDDQRKEMDRRMTVLLTAAKNGVIEMVEKILQNIPVAIEDRTTEEKNILLVAVENRQPRIVEALTSHDFWKSLVQTVDKEGNNVLHLAAKVSKYKPWQIPGAAMQMQWEIKWYQFVKEIVPHQLIFQTNHEEYTPGEIFTENHKNIAKEGTDWLKSTSESCSVVAALIAGVSFATSSSVPGGNDDKTGKPTLEGQPAFNIFAITSLVALCFSVTALVMFLAILTSRQQPKDFRRDLPFKLLLGMSSLFVSIASMLVSFCAAHFFVLKDKMNNVVFVIYAATCLPVSLYAVAQFPLYLDLLKTILTKVPQPSYRDDDL